MEKNFLFPSVEFDSNPFTLYTLFAHFTSFLLVRVLSLEFSVHPDKVKRELRKFYVLFSIRMISSIHSVSTPLPRQMNLNNTNVTLYFLPTAKRVYGESISTFSGRISVYTWIRTFSLHHTLNCYMCLHTPEKQTPPAGILSSYNI